LLILPALALGQPPAVAAQPGQARAEVGGDPGRTLRLDRAIDLALERNPSLAAQEHAVDAARWSHRQAKAQLLPSVSFETRYTRLDEETVARANAFGREITMWLPDSSGNLQPVSIEIPQTVFRDGYETSISAQLLLLNPALWNAAAIAGTSHQAADWRYEAQRETTAYETLRGFVELLKLQSLLEIQEQHLEQARKNLAQAERLWDVGRYAEADVLRWRVEEARQSGLLLQQRSARCVASLTLENLIGLSPLGEVRADTLLPARLRQEIVRFRAFGEADWARFMQQPLERAITGNPQLRVLDRTARLAELEHRQSLTNFLPTVTVAGSYGWQNNDTIDLDGEKAWSVSALFSLPLFTSGANLAGRQATGGKLAQAEAEVEAARRGLMLAAEAGRTAIRSYVEQLRLAEVSLASARRNYEIRANSFQLGRLSNLEWIDAQLALLEAEQTYSSAHYDLVLAIADYYQASGKTLWLVAE
ncbi:MAG: hypothetical protein GF330_14245, partial [Candidatus Eisenbacteria bacterium]|nr:hypothetical protein [Candidatus Eisenbacteria bacterium]